MLSRKLFHKSKLALAIAAAISFPVMAAADSEVVRLDVKAQVANKAILDLASQANLQIVLKNGSGEGLNLPGLEGEYTVDQALERMLSGTGLTYRYITDDSILIEEGAEQVEVDTSVDNDVDEEVVITGSRLITDSGKLTRQMTFFDRAEIERSGATRLDEFLRRLPQNMNAPTNVGSGISDFNASDFGLSGNAFAGSSVNLRGLGSQYTLILIDGRRPPKGGVFGGITDISNVPIEQVERIEILFDGAAAIYGADAVGGVLNIITRKDYEGTKFSMTFGDTTKGGGQRVNLNVGHTIGWESGSLTASAFYQGQEAIDGSNRGNLEFARDSIVNSLNPSLPGNVQGRQGIQFDELAPLMWVKDIDGDGNTLNASLSERLSAGVEVDVMQTDFVFTPLGPQLVTTQKSIIVDRSNPQLASNQTLLGSAPVNPEDDGYTAIYQTQLPEYTGSPITLYDVSDSNQLGESAYIPFQGRSLSPKDETFGVSLSLRQEISENLLLSMGLNYSETDKVSDSDDKSDEFTIRTDAYFNPFLADFKYSLVTGFPQQQEVVDQQNISLTGSLDWDINEDWAVQFGFGYGDSKNDLNRLNQIAKTGMFNFGGGYSPNVADLMNGYWTDTSDFFNPVQVSLGTSFNDPLLGYSSREEFLADLVDPFIHTHNYSTSTDVDLSLEGTLFSTDAGDARAVFTLAHQREEFEIFNNHITYSSAVLRGDGSGGLEGLYEEEYGRTTDAVGAEFAVPLIGEESGVPFVDSLLVNVNARLEDYSNVEDKGVNWAAGFNWSVNDWMTVRLNRTHSLRVPEAVRSARDVMYRVRSSYRVYPDPTDLLNSYKIYEPMWLISGGSDHLESERNYGTALGFIFRPTFIDGLDIQMNITESNTLDQIGYPFAWSNMTEDTLRPENIARNPLIARADPANNPMHAAMMIVDSNGNVGAPQQGDLIVDRRPYNIGDTFNRGADLEVKYNFASDYGDWLLTWRHQYLDVNEVIQSDLCADDVCDTVLVGPGKVDGMFDIPQDTVGIVNRASFRSSQPALPEHRGSMELFWSYRGLGLSMIAGYQSDTSVINLPSLETPGLLIDDPDQRVNLIKETTRQAQSVDMVLSYDFSQGDLFDVSWLDSTRISLSVDDVWRRKRSVRSEFLQKEWDEELPDHEINPFGWDPRGRAYTLRISTTF